MTDNISAEATLEVMKKTARRAGMAILRDFSEVEGLQVSKKGPADFVSNADKKSEEIIKKELSFARPEFSFLCEETGKVDNKSDHKFIVDPLDGTTNFLHALPHFSVHIAYEYMGDIKATVTFDPIKNELYSAIKGGGAYLNDARLRVSGRTKMGDAVFATGMPFLGSNDDKVSEYLKKLENIMRKTAGIRRFGSASLDLAYVASGRYEGFFEYGLNPWDLAGGILLVREAGGFVVDDAGRTYKLEGDGVQKKWIVASNYELATEFMQTLKTKKK